MDLGEKILEEGLKHIEEAHLEPIEDEYETRICILILYSLFTNMFKFFRTIFYYFVFYFYS